MQGGHPDASQVSDTHVSQVSDTGILGCQTLAGAHPTKKAMLVTSIAFQGRA
jgi:hypothetical protein